MSRVYEAWSNRRLDTLLLNKGGTIERMGEVITYREKVPLHCKVCGHFWEASPQTTERSGCPKCYINSKTGVRKKSKYSNEEVYDILRLNGLAIEGNENYVNNKIPMSLVDLKTGEHFKLSLRSILGRKGIINPYKGLHPNEVEDILHHE